MLSLGGYNLSMCSIIRYNGNFILYLNEFWRHDINFSAQQCHYRFISLRSKKLR